VKKKLTRTEETLVRLGAISRDALPAAASEVRAALAHERALVVARAAEVAAKLELRDLAQDLVRAFDRVARAEDDPECMAADTVLKAMAKLDASAADTYLRALRMRRMVKIGNAYVDVAAPLRAHAAMALVEMGYRSALEEVAPLLADPEESVRIAAVDALGVRGGEGAAAVLLLKLKTGDGDAAVIGACLAGLLRANVDRYLPVVAKYVRGEDARVVELAAIALGESRAAGAFEILRSAAETAPRKAVGTILLSIALLRSQGGNAYLQDLVDRGPAPMAKLARSALGLHNPE
jgi:HEAT repeat protein